MGWPLLVFLIPAAAGGRQTQTTHQVDQILTVKSYRYAAILRPPSITFEDRVIATYGATTLTCDRLVINMEEGHKHGLAEGHVHIQDPDGNLSADRLFFDWVHRTGSALDVDVHVQGVMIHAKSVIVGPKLWTLEDIYATPCDGESRPLLAIRAPEAIISPGGDATILHPQLYVLGRKVVTLRRYTISPNRRGNGQPIPSVSYNRSSGFSAGWNPGLSLDDSTAINGSVRGGQHQRPSEDLLLSRSLLPPSQSLGGFIPRSDFEERFNFSYFGNVFIGTPDAERAYVSARRQSLSVGTAWNEYPAARLQTDAFTKPIELIYERADTFGGFGAYAQIRAQKIQELHGASENRVITSAAVLLPEIDFGRRVYTDIRLDGSAFTGDKNTFGWGHMQLGLVAKPTKYVRLGAAYELAFETGTPTFRSDRLFKTHSLDLRADLVLGPRKLSVLEKYDPLGKRWYDTEFQVSQVMSCVEPFLIYRQFPRGYAIGIRLRVDGLLDTIRRRQGLKPDRNNTER